MPRHECPKVSIIVPVYNVENYITECLNSLISQTLRDIEIICIDDHSTDNSVAIINKFIKQDKRIKLIQKKQNSGQSDARNIGIEKSSAPYVMFCDGDDFYSPTMCAELYDAIQESGADIGMCGINIIYETDAHLKSNDDGYYQIKYTGVHTVTHDLIKNCDGSSCNKIFKRSIIDRHSLSYPVGLKYEDAYWFFCYMLWAKTAVFINKKLYNYIRHKNSTMNHTFHKDSALGMDHIKIAIAVFDYMKKHKRYADNMEYFWTSIFVPYFNLARSYCNKVYHDTIHKIAHDFVKENYTEQNLDWYTNRIIKMIANNTFKNTKKYAFGIISVTETIDYTLFRFIGIPVYKIKYFKDYMKYYLFGIQYKIKHVFLF